MTLCVRTAGQGRPGRLPRLPACTGCPMGSADVDRAGPVRPASIGGSRMFYATFGGHELWSASKLWGGRGSTLTANSPPR